MKSSHFSVGLTDVQIEGSKSQLFLRSLICDGERGSVLPHFSLHPHDEIW